MEMKVTKEETVEVVADLEAEIINTIHSMRKNGKDYDTIKLNIDGINVYVSLFEKPRLRIDNARTKGKINFIN